MRKEKIRKVLWIYLDEAIQKIMSRSKYSTIHPLDKVRVDYLVEQIVDILEEILRHKRNV